MSAALLLAVEEGVNAILLGQEVLTIGEIAHGLLEFPYLVTVP